MTQDMKPTTEQYDAYKMMFDHFNVELFEGKLPNVLLNLSRSGSSRTVAFFAPDRWRKGEQVTHEISINPRHLRADSAEYTAASLVHEMAHLWQHVHGTPPRRGYHDKAWTSKMVAIGLQPRNAKTGEIAKSAHQMTVGDVLPDGSFAKAFASLPPGALLPWSCEEAAPRATVKKEEGEQGEGGEGEGESETPAPVSKNKVKYSCPKCNANVWGKQGLKIGCVNVDDHDDESPALFEAA